MMGADASRQVESGRAFVRALETAPPDAGLTDCLAAAGFPPDEWVLVTAASLLRVLDWADDPASASEP